MPRPRSLPRALASRRARAREAVPVGQREPLVEDRARSRRCRRLCAIGLVYGICSGRIMLRRRSSAGSSFSSRAAASIRRSMM